MDLWVGFQKIPPEGDDPPEAKHGLSKHTTPRATTCQAWPGPDGPGLAPARPRPGPAWPGPAQAWPGPDRSLVVLRKGGIQTLDKNKGKVF